MGEKEKAPLGRKLVFVSLVRADKVQFYWSRNYFTITFIRNKPFSLFYYVVKGIPSRIKGFRALPLGSQEKVGFKVCQMIERVSTAGPSTRAAGGQTAVEIMYLLLFSSCSFTKVKQQQLEPPKRNPPTLIYFPLYIFYSTAISHLILFSLSLPSDAIFKFLTLPCAGETTSTLVTNFSWSF